MSCPKFAMMNSMIFPIKATRDSWRNNNNKKGRSGKQNVQNEPGACCHARKQGNYKNK